MSIILGYKAEDKLYLAADNRVSSPEDEFIRDDDTKILVINNSVAVAFAGYSGTQTLFEKFIKDNNESLRVEDALLYIRFIYWICKIPWYKKYTKNILKFGSRFIVAGKNRKNEYCMYIVSYVHGKFEKPSLTDRFLFPPSDASPKLCWDFYTKNVVDTHSNFMQGTIKDIANVSKLVSPSGDIWTYDILVNTGTLEHFV